MPKSRSSSARKSGSSRTKKSGSSGAKPGKLAEYRTKRDFSRTPEPAGEAAGAPGSGLRFVIQKHDATNLHYDLRLEMDGVMRSWAVPKGPSLDPSVKRLAMEVEDHPIEYNDFEGIIPEGEYGGGTVMIWDEGTYEPDEPKKGETAEEAALRGYREGKLSLTLHGERLKGSFALVRTDTVEGGIRSKWLFFKHRDGDAAPGTDVTAEVTTSVVSGRTMDEIAAGKGEQRVWHSNRDKPGSKRPRRSSAPPPAVDYSALQPMLATLGRSVPSGKDWIFEPKYDGIRVLAFATAGAVALISRNGHDKAAQFPEIVAALTDLVEEIGEPVVLDGEVVAIVDGRLGRFEAIQGRMHTQDARKIQRDAAEQPAAFVTFDILLRGEDVLVAEPWRKRRKALEEVLRGRTNDTLRLSDVADDHRRLLEQARREHWEGLIAKRATSTYRPGQRSRDWVKVKLENQQELVVGGWTEPRGSREHIGAILLGYYDADGNFVYAGHTGGGFDRRSLAEMHRRLKPLERKTPPFSTKPRTNQPAHWTSPRVVVEVRFNEWTKDGKLRQPVFLGFRDDKDPKEVVRELPGGNGRPARTADEVEAVEEGEAALAEIAATAVETDAAPATRDGTGTSRKKTAGRARKKTEGSRTRTTTGDGTARGKPATDASRAEDAGDDARQKSPRDGTQSAGARGSAAGDRARKKAPGSTARGTKRSRTPTSRKAARDPADDDPIVQRIRELAAGRGSGELKLDRGASIPVTNLGKTFFPKTGHTKEDLLVYYTRMREYILPWMKDRPLVLKRFPNGVDGEAFYQQAAPDPAPPSVRVETLRIEDKDQQRVVGGNLATLLYTIQLGAISYDPWHSRVGALHSADYAIVDLDPGEGTKFDQVVEVARWVKDEMYELGLHGAIKTSGSRGMHVYLPLPPRTPLDAAMLVAQIVATRVAQKHPKQATIERMTKNRPSGTVYVDYLQNILGKTVAGVYAVRARPEPTVSTPLDWDEVVRGLDPRDFTIDTVPDRVAEVGDLWAKAMKKPNSLEKLR